MQAATGQRSRLTEAQRRELLSILSGRPHLSNGQVARLFEARTGRPLSRPAICRARARGYPSLDPGRPRCHLLDGERGILERCCHRAAPGYSRAAIARAFAPEAGRPIGLSSVGDFLRRHFEDSPQARRMTVGKSDGHPARVAPAPRA